jgi:hypothetical protein
MVAIADSKEWLCPNDYIWPRHLRMNNGMFGVLEGCKTRIVSDGLTNTLMLGEATGGLPGSYAGFYWGRHNLTDTRDGINGPFTVPGGGTYIANDGTGAAGFRATGPSSYHAGGCHFAMGDASVQFLSENTAANVLRDMATRASQIDP